MLRDGTAENSEDKICKGKEQNHKRIIEVKKMERYMILIRTDGTGRLIRCDDGDTCKLETLQQLVGGLIETADSCLEPGWAREPVDSIKLIDCYGEKMPGPHWGQTPMWST